MSFLLFTYFFLSPFFVFIYCLFCLFFVFAICWVGLSPSASAKAGSLGDVWTFNMDHAYCEAICRGYKKGFLTDSEYIHLHSATNLSGKQPNQKSQTPKLTSPEHAITSFFPDIKLNLQETDFGEFLREVENLTPKAIKNEAIQKFTDEFQWVIFKHCLPNNHFQPCTRQFIVLGTYMYIRFAMS